jgi:rare lipoprotein A (peptidoglycan hydrolase)
MIKKAFVVLAFLAVLAAWGLEKMENASIQAKADGISASLNELKSEVGKVRTENLLLKGEIDEVKSRVLKMEMVASWYGPGFHGRTAADGSTYDQFAFTCAHKTLPFGTVLVVEGANGRRVPVVVTDRGPFVKGRDIDLSYATAERVGLLRKGVAPVQVYQFRL